MSLEQYRNLFEKMTKAEIVEYLESKGLRMDESNKKHYLRRLKTTIIRNSVDWLEFMHRANGLEL